MSRKRRVGRWVFRSWCFIGLVKYLAEQEERLASLEKIRQPVDSYSASQHPPYTARPMLYGRH